MAIRSWQPGYDDLARRVRKFPAVSPPPPPLGRGRKRAAQTFDEALDDAELISVRAALAQGRWQSVRSLLVHTGDDWDRRGHRMAVLAKEPHCAPWAREWLLAEPDSADASALLALALVHRALRGKEKPARVREACRDAAALVPDDPTPWLGLLMLERSLGTDEDVIRVFDEVRGRYADHHHAHHLMVARLAERGDGGGPDPLHEVYDFANWAAEQGPPPTPRWPSSPSSHTPSATACWPPPVTSPPTRPPRDTGSAGAPGW